MGVRDTSRALVYTRARCVPDCSPPWASCFSLALAGDARCKGTPTARAARFSEKSLKGRQPAERYAEYVRAKV